MNTTPTAEDASFLPRWDVSVVYPSLTSPEFEAGFSEAVTAIHGLQQLFDAEGIRAPEGNAAPTIDDALVARFERVTNAFNEVLRQVGTVRAFIHAFVTTDSRDALAQGKASELRREGVTLGNLGTRFTAWLGALDVEALIARSPVAADHAYYLHEAQIAARHQLSPAEEELAADLSLSGAGAWAKLHSDLTSQITVPLDGREEPMSVIRALASDSARDVRRRAYEAELVAWEKNALPLAAALNAIKHEQNVLARRRGWGEALDVALFNNHIDRPTLDAMLSAARKSFPHFRRYFQAKARLVSGDERLPWFDLFAPVGETTVHWDWGRAESFVAEQFGNYSDRMRAFAERSFRERWIDAEPRPGKRDGAFCMPLRADESRILQNYKPAFGGVSTLAHELGHAYHNVCLAERTPLQKGTPSTLAETASIFCETIIRQAALTDGGDAQDQIAILEASLQGSSQVVVDITSRFDFEAAVLTRRKDRELSVPELNEIMLQTQRDTYGDGLDEAVLHPYMWAVKGHYYGPTFYNFPYMFGLLFALGLYAQYQADPDGFRARYDELLSLTGMATAAELAERFGIDIRDEAFWASSLEVIRGDVDRFEALARDLRP
jgi:pepF/M3 family oligoendopeptidase